MMDCIDIGPAPCDEDCAQVGEEGYVHRALDECRRFIDLIRKKLGPEPEGARLRVKANPHDFGTYHEVVCEFWTDEGQEYALQVERDAPSRWEE